LESSAFPVSFAGALLAAPLRAVFSVVLGCLELSAFGVFSAGGVYGTTVLLIWAPADAASRNVPAESIPTLILFNISYHLR
jgi:hypothetical protein